MRQAVIAAENRKNFSGIEQVLKKNDFVIDWADSGRAALEFCRTQKNMDLLILDEDLGDMKAKEAVEKAIMANPMINCVPVSSLTHEEFHEAFEGLGVLMQLPPTPGIKDAEDLISCINRVFNLTTRS